MDNYKSNNSEMEEIFRINSKYFELTKQKKLEGLIVLNKWINKEINKLSNI